MGACKKISLANCTNNVFSCSGSTSTGGNIDANVISMELGYRSASFKYATYDRVQNVTCPSQSNGFFEASGGAWSIQNGQQTAEVETAEILTVVESTSSCYKCTGQ